MAKRPRRAIQQIRNRPLLPTCREAQRHGILERSIAMRLILITQREWARNSCLSGRTRLGIEHLPNPPHAIDGRMVGPEGRVARRNVQVTARIAAQAEVPTAVYTLLYRVGDAVHDVLESCDVVGDGDGITDRGIIGEALVGVVGQRALQAARVVVEGEGAVIGLAVDEAETIGPKVDALRIVLLISESLHGSE